ncbi:hypothetical protein GCM10025867_23390 [Frondihabitans sucicola]|uniref:Uncharacterized protein n=1 Tax=Frondihabitans sucicola TaxID=1268041 RepID=A0ABN6XYS3_9MICO|nr:hypothetical protein GCM10025867_23390 [Frondihabitans sucicola]
MAETRRPSFRGAGRSLEVLRAEAHDELRTLIELRCRGGEDPWEVIPELPSVDEQVVISSGPTSSVMPAPGCRPAYR